jgi:hypothetical protein
MIVVRDRQGFLYAGRGGRVSMLANHLVGRAEELGSIDRVLSELAQGRAITVELVGECGIGKTRLLGELAARAEQRGDLVPSGSASELERTLPFSVFVDALDEYVEGLDQGARSAGPPDVGEGARRHTRPMCSDDATCRRGLR